MIDDLIFHPRAVEGDLHSQVVLLRLHHVPTHLHQVPVQPAGSEEELPPQFSLGPVVQEHQQAALCALPLQLGGTWSYTMKSSGGHVSEADTCWSLCSSNIHTC